MVVDIRPEEGAVPILLVTIATKVEVYRLTSVPGGASVAWATGNGPLQFHPGLVKIDDIDTEIDLFDLTYQSTVDSCRMEVVLPGGASSEALEARCYSLCAALVEVAMVWPGQDYAARTVLLDGGRVTGLTLAGADGVTEIYCETRGPPAAASAVDASRDLGVTYPAGAGSYPDLLGRQFPVVVGRVYQVPVYRVGTSQAGAYHSGILAGHHLAESVTIGSLTFYEDGVAAPLSSPTLENGTDPDANPVSWVQTDFSQLTSSDDPITVDFTAGGVPSVARSALAAVGLGEVLEWLLVNSGVRVDISAQRRTTRLLNGWEGGVYLDRYDDLLEVVRLRLAPFLPIVETVSSRGLSFRYADPRLAPLEFAVTVGQELIGPVGGVGMTAIDAVRNSFFMEFGYSHATAKFEQTLTFGATDSEMCRYSRQLFGEVADAATRCTITWDAPTARRILQTRAERLALPRRLVRYLADPSTATTLREGMVGTVTDADRGIVAHRAVLRRWRVTGSPWEATFELVDRPPVSRL